MDKSINVPLDLFDALVENTRECWNMALNNNDDRLANIYQEEMEQCKNIRIWRIF